MILMLKRKQYANKYVSFFHLRSFYLKFIQRALQCYYTLYKMKVTQITADFVVMSQRPL